MRSKQLSEQGGCRERPPRTHRAPPKPRSKTLGDPIISAHNVPDHNGVLGADACRNVGDLAAVAATKISVEHQRREITPVDRRVVAVFIEREARSPARSLPQAFPTLTMPAPVLSASH